MTTEAETLKLVESTALSATAEIVEMARGEGGDVRALGGVAIALRCPTARTPGRLARGYSDIDLVTARGSVAAVVSALTRLEYVPHERFNALHGHARMLFDRGDGVHVDLFVDEFAMCHRLRLAPRLSIHDTTVSLADLLLTKLQVARLNAKDVTDAAALFVDHDVTDDESGVNGRYVAELLAKDWGWWRTVTENLGAVSERLDGHLEGEPAGRARARIAVLCDLIANAPKGIRWKARSRAGDRIPWRDEPEDAA